MAATRPVPETKGRLAALAGGEDKIERLKAKGAAELSELRTVRLGKLLQEKAEADFLVVFSSASSSKPEDVKFISGSEKVRPLAGALRSAKFPAVFPDETPTRIVRRGTLTCLPDGKCVFVVLAPDNVTTIN
jgi:hypothetical protein